MGLNTMRNKHDMYINYERSYKRRRRKGIRKTIKIFILVLIVLGLGAGAFYVIKTQINTANRIKELDQGTDTGEISPIPSIAQDENIQPSDNQVDNNNTNITGTPTVNEPTENTNQNGESLNEVIYEKDMRIPVKVKGIYVTASGAGSDKMGELSRMSDSKEINAMVIDVKNDFGKITYPMDSTTVTEIGSASNEIADMASLVTNLKGKGIYLIARVVAFKDPYLAEHKQELAIKNKDGSLYRDNKGDCWVNPYHKEVWDYLVEVASQAAAIGFDEVQFDYIRFPTGVGLSNVDYGTDADTKTKEAAIIEFTKYVYEKLKPLGVFVSADVYGTIISSSIDAGLVGQNYVEMSKYLDFICPMIYPSHFGEGNYGIDYPDLEPLAIVRKVLTASKTKLLQIPEGEHRATVRPWLQDFTATWLAHYQAYGGPELRAQIDGVYGAGYEEWLVWNANGNYSEDGLLKE